MWMDFMKREKERLEAAHAHRDNHVRVTFSLRHEAEKEIMFAPGGLKPISLFWCAIPIVGGPFLIWHAHNDTSLAGDA